MPPTKQEQLAIIRAESEANAPHILRTLRQAAQQVESLLFDNVRIIERSCQECRSSAVATDRQKDLAHAVLRHVHFLRDAFDRNDIHSAATHAMAVARRYERINDRGPAPAATGFAVFGKWIEKAGPQYRKILLWLDARGAEQPLAEWHYHELDAFYYDLWPPIKAAGSKRRVQFGPQFVNRVKKALKTAEKLAATNGIPLETTYSVKKNSLAFRVK